MTNDQVTLYAIQGVIRATYQSFQRQGVYLAAAKLREILQAHNDHGLMAFALVVAELQVEGKS